MGDTGKKIVFRTLGFNLSTLGSVTSNVFKVPKTAVNTFDGTDPKVDRIKPKVRNTIFFPVRLRCRPVFDQFYGRQGHKIVQDT